MPNQDETELLKAVNAVSTDGYEPVLRIIEANPHLINTPITKYNRSLLIHVISKSIIAGRMEPNPMMLIEHLLRQENLDWNIRGLQNSTIPEMIILGAVSRLIEVAKDTPAFLSHCGHHYEYAKTKLTDEERRLQDNIKLGGPENHIAIGRFRLIERIKGLELLRCMAIRHAIRTDDTSIIGCIERAGANILAPLENGQLPLDLANQRTPRGAVAKILNLVTYQKLSQQSDQIHNEFYQEATARRAQHAERTIALLSEASIFPAAKPAKPVPSDSDCCASCTIM